MKNNEMWIIKSGSIYLPLTTRATKGQCVEDYCRHYRGYNCKWIYSEWKKRKKDGHSCVKIRVEEI